MNRSKFVTTSLLGIAGIAFAPALTFGHSGQQGLPANWAWMNGSVQTSDTSWRELFDKMMKANIGGLLVNGSNELYEKIGPLSMESGIQIHAWRWTMNRGDYMKEHPEWYTVNRLGESVVDKPPYVGYYRWLCPSRPEVTDLLIKDYSQLTEIPGLKGVHLDYVRYCDIYLPVGLLPKYDLVQDHEMPEFDYCYCPLCRATFKEKSGYDPLDQKDPSQDPDWHRFRLDQLVTVVQKLARAIHDKGSLITAAVFPTPEMSRRMVRQDWAQFQLDAYFPMLYNEYYLEPTGWIADCVKETRKEMGNEAPIYPGMMMNRRTFPPSVLEKTIQQIKKAGGQGISAFTASGLTDDQLEVLRRAGS